MHESVVQRFPSFSEQFEGRVNHMYADVKGLVTIGIGNLIDPVKKAIEEHRRFGPFVHHDDGRPATELEVEAEWHKVKTTPGLAQQGWRAAAQVAHLELTNASVDQMVSQKQSEFTHGLRQTKEFADIDQWPADAQLAILSMAWAMGWAFGPSWPNFRSACSAHDWKSAAANCRMRDSENPGLRPRNIANRVLFLDAHYAVANRADDLGLFYIPSGARPTLRRNDSGKHVSYLQERLRDLKYGTSMTDVFDEATHSALTAFQRLWNLEPDGIAGAQTWAAIGTLIPSDEMSPLTA